MDECGSFSDEEVEILRCQVTKLTSENAELRAKTVSLTDQLVSAKSSCESDSARRARKSEAWQVKKEHEGVVEELQTRLRIAGESNRERIDKAAIAHQIEKEHLIQKISCLQNKLKVAENSVTVLKTRCGEKQEECGEVQQRSDKAIESLKSEQREMLAAAGVYFHTMFPSLQSLKTHLLTKPVLEIEETEPFTWGCPCVEKTPKNVKRQLASERAENEALRVRVREESGLLARESSRLVTKTRELEKAVVELRETRERLDRRTKEAAKLKVRTQQQNETIAKQQGEIETLSPGGSSAIQIARLRDENNKLKDKVSATAEKAKRVEVVTEVKTVEPVIVWDSIEGRGIPSELAETLATVVENDALSVQARFRHSFKTICKYYEIRQRNLASSSEKNARKNAGMVRQLGAFVEAISLLLVQRSVPLENVADDDAVQREILDAAKDLKVELKDAIRENRRLQRSFPAEELAQLREENANRQKKVRDQKKMISELRRRIPSPQNDIKALRDEIENANGKSRSQPVEEVVVSRASAKTVEKKDDKCSNDTVKELNRRISSLEKENAYLTKECEETKTAFIARMKSARLDAIREYEDLVAQLKERVSSQRATIETLTKRIR